MVRPLRIEYPGANYHVINRGNRGERIFFKDSDYTFFIDKMSEYADLFDVVIHCYCILSNHFHLMVTTKHANLSKFMQSFTTSFTVSMNYKYNKPGHIFQGRYKAQLVESELYKNELSRYIHLNPIKLQTYRSLPLTALKKNLHDYKWSSYRSYIGICRKPDWLNRSFVLSSWGKTSTEKLNNYRTFIEEGLLTDNLKKIRSNQINNIIGSDSFKDRIIKKYLIKNFADIDEHEQPDLSIINSVSLQDVLDVVLEYFKLESSTKITLKTSSSSEARKIAIYLVGKYCRKQETLICLAKQFELTISGFNMSMHRFVQILKVDKQLRKSLNELEELLLNN